MHGPAWPGGAGHGLAWLGTTAYDPSFLSDDLWD